MLAVYAHSQKLLFPKSKVVNKKAMLPATPTYLFVTQLVTQTLFKGVRLLIYIGKWWRG